jgi:hypothetical protein
VQYLPWLGRGLRQFPRRRDLLANAVTECNLVHCYGLYNLICPVGVREAAKQKKPLLLEPLGMHPPRAKNQLAKWVYTAFLTKWMLGVHKPWSLPHKVKPPT